MSQQPAKPFDFNRQKAIGEEADAVIDDYFSGWYDIHPASPEEQRRGIDRLWYGREGGVTSAEYKLDKVAAKSGFAFVEIDTNGKGDGSGWAHTSRATWLVYYVPGEAAELIYLIAFINLRAQLDYWRKRCRVVSVPNATYDTRGLLVPLREFERIARQVISL